MQAFAQISKIMLSLLEFANPFFQFWDGDVEHEQREALHSRAQGRAPNFHDQREVSAMYRAPYGLHAAAPSDFGDLQQQRRALSDVSSEFCQLARYNLPLAGPFASLGPCRATHSPLGFCGSFIIVDFLLALQVSFNLC